MSHTARAVYAAMFEPSRLTEAQRAFVEQSNCPSDAPTEREWREYRDSQSVSRSEWRRWAGN